MNIRTKELLVRNKAEYSKIKDEVIHMREERRISNIERILTVLGLGAAGAAFLITGAFTGLLSAGMIPAILGAGFLTVMFMYLSNTTVCRPEV